MASNLMRMSVRRALLVSNRSIATSSVVKSKDVTLDAEARDRIYPRIGKCCASLSHPYTTNILFDVLLFL